VNASVKAYFALSSPGHSPDLPFMQEARANILRLGGIPRMNTYSKLYLCAAGAVPVALSAVDPGGDDLLPEMGAVSTSTDVVVEPRRC
jgi:squalene-hopene/tetraprenyl-beta-curcumene cyclase